MNRRILERRLQCLEYHFNGVKPSIWVPRVAQDYGVSEHTIWTDWGRRKIWVPKMASLKDASGQFSELLVMLEKLIQKAWRLASTADNDSARVGAIRTAGVLIERYFDIATDRDGEELLRRIERLEGRMMA